MATKNQIKFIHVLKAKIGLPDEHYRDILGAFGVTSSASQLFSMESANEMIDALIRMAREKGIEIENTSHVQNDIEVLKHIYSSLKEKGSRYGYATYGQMCKILKMWWEVSRMKTSLTKFNALNQFLLNKWGINRLEWLPIEYVGKVIKTIGSMKPDQQ